ncbi:MAG: 50S ribosomal protein L17 [Pseudomonadota bacterium]
MRHRKFGKRLNMGPAHRKAMIRNMLTALIEHEEIQTTDTRCKILKREFDRLVTLGRKDSVHARRLAAGKVFGKDAVQKLFNELAPRFQGRPGGYSRIYKIGQRRGDGAPVSLIRLIPEGEAVPHRTKTKAEPEAPVVETAPVVEEIPEIEAETIE